MFQGNAGRTTALINNIVAAAATVYLLFQYDLVVFAAAVILFALSVSVTHCKMRLPITLPILVLNICLLCLSAGFGIYLIVEQPSAYHELQLYIILGLLSIAAVVNTLIIRNLHLGHHAE